MNKFSALDVAVLLREKYKKRYNKELDEMKLHKLLYFLYRENIIRNNKPLFNEKFYGWKFGPVLKSIRQAYKEGNFDNINISVPKEIKNDKNLNALIDFVIEEYGQKKSWSLSLLTHSEISWKNARKGIEEGANGDIAMKYEDIEKDAKNVKERRKRFNKKIRGI